MSRLNKWIHVNAFVLLIAVSVPGSAVDIEGFMDDMFLSASSDPGVINSQRRGGVTGGAYRLRTPIRSINLVTFSGPGIDVGSCGANDLFGGSFTLVDSEEAIQLLRQIGANAAMMAFNMALETISEMIAGQVNQIREKIEAFNRMFQNTCQMAKMMYADEGEDFSQWLTDLGNIASVEEGEADDRADAELENMDTPGTHRPEEYAGNQTWKALGENGDNLQLGTLLGVSQKEAHEIVMTMVGTAMECGGEDGAGPAEAEGAQDGYSAQKLGLKDLLHSGQSFAGEQSSSAEPKALQIYECDTGISGDCCNPELNQAYQFKGFTENVLEKLDAIESAVVNADHSALNNDAEIARFVNATSLPVVKVFSRYSGNAQIRAMMKAMMGEIIAEEFLYEFGAVLVNKLRFIFDGTNYWAPQNFNQTLAQIRAEMREIRPNASKGMEDYLLLLNMMETLDQFQYRAEAPSKWGTAGEG